MVVHLMSIKLMAYGLSDMGLVRQNNEDVWLCSPEQNLFVIADGMGGHQAGEIAAREAVTAFFQIFHKLLKKEGKENKSIINPQGLVQKAFEHANSVVYSMGRTHGPLRGMGTTLCCLYFTDSGLVYAHVGDSRIYLLRNKKILQLTQDHSLLRELIDLGQINEQQATDFLYKNIITKAVGTEPKIEPTINFGKIVAKDRYLMCTDGLSDLLSSQEIESILNQNLNNREAVEQLIAEAKARGGHDNITVALIEVAEI